MKAEYTIFRQETKIVDPLDEYIKFLDVGLLQAEKNWRSFLTTSESYCYGRNDPNLNLHYAEKSKFKLKHSFLPDNLEKDEGLLFKKLLNQ